jgi:hypothetical protein
MNFGFFFSMKNPEIIIFFMSKFCENFVGKGGPRKGPQFLCYFSHLNCEITSRIFFFFWLLKKQVPNRTCLLDKFSFLGGKDIWENIWIFLNIA